MIFVRIRAFPPAVISEFMDICFIIQEDFKIFRKKYFKFVSFMLTDVKKRCIISLQITDHLSCESDSYASGCLFFCP